MGHRPPRLDTCHLEVDDARAALDAAGGDAEQGGVEGGAEMR